MSLQRSTREIDLEAELELKNIYFIEVSSRHWNAIPDEQESPPERTTHHLSVLQNINGRSISVRGRLVVKTPQALLIADAAAVYELKEDKGGAQNDTAEEQQIELSEEALKAFAENEGVPAIFPFLREAITSGARKINTKAPVLGILHRGSVELSRHDK
ncbi:hypothetical protein [[Actinomadura] parvosata]|uniref:hypothetical protein n=1 Tax=[Actinomadura] parvosata TaxID=1955412 RepID=UPI0012BCD9F5|nr:hypothetical protein [Nonomuraea sp. ATCC 55076]